MAGLVGLAAGVAAPTMVLTALADKEGKDSVQRMFDPEALERGAAALKEINKSPYAKNVSSTCHITRQSPPLVATVVVQQLCDTLDQTVKHKSRAIAQMSAVSRQHAWRSQPRSRSRPSAPSPAAPMASAMEPMQ